MVLAFDMVDHFNDVIHVELPTLLILKLYVAIGDKFLVVTEALSFID